MATQMKDGETRISVALLAPRICDVQTGELASFGVLNRALYNDKGIKRIQALGGAAFLTPQGHERLVREFGAHDFAQDSPDSPFDARFVVSNEHVETVLSMFEELDSALFDTSLVHEVVPELCHEKLNGIPAVLEEGEAKRLAFFYNGFYHQPLPEDGTGTSSRGAARRLFHLFTMLAVSDTFDKVFKSRAVAELNEADLLSTNGGRRKGLSVSGSEIADNIFAFNF